MGLMAVSTAAGCLPDDVKGTDIVGHRTLTSRSGSTRPEKVTVKQTLRTLRSRCVKGKLVDSKGREIRFYRLKGCWGNPPTDYLEIIENQRREIETLKRHYTLVEMGCDTDGQGHLRP
jgi:hypothetical protein